jgi:post-segregation antitoxin (ccd killing protein)
MSNVTQDLVTVNMRGMKAALVARARARGVGVSTIVRTAVARELELDASRESPQATDEAVAGRGVKVSIRLTFAEATQLAVDAKEAGLSRGAYVGGLVGGVAVLARRPDHVAALTASCGELAILSRNIHHLAALFRQGTVQAAREYTAMLDSLRDEVRRHLRVAAEALADLRPRRALTTRLERRGGSEKQDG